MGSGMGCWWGGSGGIFHRGKWDFTAETRKIVVGNRESGMRQC